MRFTFLLFLFYCITIPLYSQNVTFRWADQIGSSKGDAGQSITTDPSGNVITTGSFEATADFDPGPGTYNLTPAGVNDVFISKHDGNGNLVWAKQLGSVDNQQSYGVATDANGDIYVTGPFSGTMDFDPGPGTSNFSSAFNGYAIFIIKLDSNGNFIWGKEVANNFYANYSYAICLDPTGNIYTTGFFRGTSDFDPGPGVFNLSSTATSGEAFILKLDNNGNFIWAKQFNGTNGDICYGMAVDANQNIYTTGLFSETCDFDPGPGIYALTAPGGSTDVFICKLDINGDFVWAKQMGGQLGDVAMSIALDKAGNIFTTGKFQGTADYDPGPGIANLTATVYYATFISKLDNNGNFIWAKQFDDVSGGCEGMSVATDISGNVYTTGIFYGTIDFDPGGTAFTYQSDPGGDIFISKLDANGNFVFAKQIGSASFDDGISMNVDAAQNIYVTGYFFDQVDFDPGSTVYNLTDNGMGDAFVLKLSQCTNSLATLVIDTCDSYTLNNQTYTTSGIYTQTLPNKAGCDSLITLHLTIGGSSTTLSDTACDSYSWQGQNITASGTYTVKFAGVNGCDSILNLNLVIRNKAVTSITQSICDGQNYAGYIKSGIYTDTFTAANGCDSIRTLNLTVKPRSIFSTSQTICEGTNYLGYTQTGTYTDTLISVNGCDSIRILHLYVNPLQISTNNVSICEGSSYFAGGAYQTLSGIYRDTLVAVAGCDSIITTNLSVHSKPLIDLGQDRNLCFRETITLQPGSFATYQWQDGSTAQDFIVADTGTYWVKVTDMYNCTASDTLVIKDILPVPADFLPQTDSICQYEKLTVTATGNYADYLWSTGSIQPYIIAASAGKYVLTVKDFNGCKGSDTVTIAQKNCYSGVYIPSAFTPNGDQLNDVFRAKVYGAVISFNLRVYNRFGGLVFTTTDAQKGWNGNVKGNAADADVFVWLCSYQLQGGKPVSEKGTITLIR